MKQEATIFFLQVTLLGFVFFKIKPRFTDRCTMALGLEPPTPFRPPTPLAEARLITNEPFNNGVFKTEACARLDQVAPCCLHAGRPRHHALKVRFKCCHVNFLFSPRWGGVLLMMVANPLKPQSAVSPPPQFTSPVQTTRGESFKESLPTAPEHTTDIASILHLIFKKQTQKSIRATGLQQQVCAQLY